MYVDEIKPHLIPCLSTPSTCSVKIRQYTVTLTPMHVEGSCRWSVVDQVELSVKTLVIDRSELDTQPWPWSPLKVLYNNTPGRNWTKYYDPTEFDFTFSNYVYALCETEVGFLNSVQTGTCVQKPILWTWHCNGCRLLNASHTPTDACCVVKDRFITDDRTPTICIIPIKAMSLPFVVTWPGTESSIALPWIHDMDGESTARCR